MGNRMIGKRVAAPAASSRRPARSAGAKRRGTGGRLLVVVLVGAFAAGAGGYWWRSHAGAVPLPASGRTSANLPTPPAVVANVPPASAEPPDSTPLAEAAVDAAEGPATSAAPARPVVVAVRPVAGAPQPAAEPEVPVVAVAAAEPKAAGFAAARPILLAKCGACHGEKKASAGLDVRTLDALVRGGEGGPAVVPGAPAKSLLWQRVAAGDMPPAKSGLSLTDAEKSAVREWILHEKARANVLADKSAPAVSAAGDALFATKTYAPLDNPPRLWRISPDIYDQFTRELLRVKANAKTGNLPQAFTANADANFQDVATGGSVDEPTTVLLLQNAYNIAEFQLQKNRQQLAKVTDPSRPPTRPDLEAIVQTQFQAVLQRNPTPDETKRFADLMVRVAKEGGPEVGVRTGMAAVLLTPDAVFRLELGQGAPDAQGRRRLTGREIAYAIAYALTDRHPDKALLEAADRGKLATRDGVAQEVARLLNDAATDKPRILRFFREYFGYHRAPDVFKETKDFPDHEPHILVKDTDRLVEHVLARDKNVFAELLTTNQSFVASAPPPKNQNQRYRQVISRSYGLEEPPAQQPVELPAAQRCGILTQPSWLVAHSANTENHAILRGKWVREKLLGGTIPDLPITVDAQLPEDPHKTLRQRMAVTQEKYCWQCHQKMNPLGLTFEMYDHFGRFRTEELKKPVDASGLIDLTGDARLEGSVTNAIDLIKKLAASDRARHTFVQYAFRYWTGRTENPGDARSLQEVDLAYTRSGGSMKALITALLTSESFLYRTVPTTSARPATK